MIRTTTLEPNRRPLGRHEQGSTLLLVLFVTAATLMLIAASTASTLQQSASTRFALNQAHAESLAEAVVTIAEHDLRHALAHFQSPSLVGEVSLGGELYTYSVEAVGPTITDTTGPFPRQAQAFRIRSEVQLASSRGTCNSVVQAL